MPILSNCCCFLDLKVGTKIIGILALISSLVGSIALGIGVALWGAAAATFNTFIEETHKEIAASDDYSDVGEVSKTIMELIKQHVNSATIVLYVLLALSLLCVITSSMLIHGVKHDRRHLLLPYCVQEVLNVIVLISVDIWIIVITQGHSDALGLFFGMLGGAIIHLYFGLVAFSQYQALGLIRMHEDISMK